jgi:signal transduction histidine kinase
MRLLLRDILVYARAGQGGHSLPLAPVSLETLVEELFASIPVPPGFRCIADSSLASIPVIAVPLVQVLRNLIENALKHHDALTGTVSIAVAVHPDHLRFAVTDDGPGIPATHREQVFEMFATLRRRDEFEASGMGLALVRKLVRQQGGRCGIESAPLRGSCVWFEWPKLDEAHAQYLPRT